MATTGKQLPVVGLQGRAGGEESEVRHSFVSVSCGVELTILQIAAYKLASSYVKIQLLRPWHGMLGSQLARVT